MPSKLHRLKVAPDILIGLALLTMGVLLFAQLGHYALWDDEAVTALDAKGILRTGDTSILMDHGNIVAYRNGAIVQNFCDRVDPPFPNYLTAASFLLLGVNALAGRLPFALVGLGTTALILYGGRRQNLSVLLILILGLCGNVTLILFNRQCRYYALCAFLTTAVLYIYWHWKPTTRTLLILAGLSVVLFASNYLNYLALYLCLAVDWALWRRKEWAPTWRRALCFLGPQIVNIPVAYLWNPLRTQHGESLLGNSPWDRCVLFFWYWRDLNQCEFFAISLLLLALGIGLGQRRAWLVRGCLAITVYIAVIALLSPQPVHSTSVADVRYLVPIIPMAIVLETGAVWAVLRGAPFLAILAAALVFGTNLFNGGPLLPGGTQSTICEFIVELIQPPQDPYTLTSDWINDHVPEGGSIWVQPDYATYPLMFRAPRALYAWQLTWPPRPDFTALPKIHFMGQEAPDYLIAFGPNLAVMEQALKSWNRPDVSYMHEATIAIFWKDLYRPELFWRTFKPVTGYDPNSQAIYIFKRNAPAATHAP